MEGTFFGERERLTSQNNGTSGYGLQKVYIKISLALCGARLAVFLVQFASFQEVSGSLDLFRQITAQRIYFHRFFVAATAESEGCSTSLSSSSFV